MILVFSQVGFNAKVFSPMVCRLKFFYSARFVIFQESGKRCSRVVLILGFICFTCVSSFLGFGILLGWRNSTYYFCPTLLPYFLLTKRMKFLPCILCNWAPGVVC